MRVGLTTAIATAIAIGIAIAGGGSGANLWLDSNGGTCTRSATQVAYSDAAACATMDDAYAVAQPGDVVRAQAGTYAAQTINYDSAKDSYPARVVFELAGFTSSAIQSLGAQHVEIRNVTLAGGTGLTLRPSTGTSWTPASKASSDWVVTGSTMTTFLLRNVSDVIIQSNTLGGWDACVQNYGPAKIGEYTPSGGASEKPAQNVLINDNTFHNFIRSAGDPCPHAECLYIDEGIDGLTISRNFFTNCALMDIHADMLNNSTTAADITIENNMLDYPRDENGVIRRTTIVLKAGATVTFDNLLIRYNSFLGRIDTDPGTTFSNPSVEGNAFDDHDGCPTELGASAWSNNIMDASPCGATDITGDPGFVSSSNATCSGWPQSDYSCDVINDLHLSSIGSPAVNAGTGSYPSIDFDGTSRPINSAPDLGAQEKG